MPVFIAALLGGLVSACGTLVGRVLVSLGIGYATFSGFNASLNWVRDQALSKLAGLPADMVQLLGVLQVGTCISIWCAAHGIILVVKGVSAGGAITKMVQK